MHILGSVCVLYIVYSVQDNFKRKKRKELISINSLVVYFSKTYIL